MDFHSLRRASLLEHLKADGVDGYLVRRPVNVAYLTGFDRPADAVVLTPNGAVLFCRPAGGSAPPAVHGCEVVSAPWDRPPTPAVGGRLQSLGVKTVGVEGGHLAASDLDDLREAFPKVTFKPVRDCVERLRVIKDGSEVELIRAAVRVTERAFAMFLSLTREADTEKDMVAALEGFIHRAGGRSAAYPVVAALGDHGAAVDPPPTDRPLAEASKLLVDFGARVQYTAALARTVRSPFDVTPTRKTRQERIQYALEDVATAVGEALDAAVAAVRPGVEAREVDAAARRVLKGAGWAERFTHPVGHGIGLEPFEPPLLSPDSTAKLSQGMVLAIGPGVYLPGWGGVRIKDLVLVGRNGAIPLTSFPRGVALPEG